MINQRATGIIVPKSMSQTGEADGKLVGSDFGHVFWPRLLTEVLPACGYFGIRVYVVVLLNLDKTMCLYGYVLEELVTWITCKISTCTPPRIFWIFQGFPRRQGLVLYPGLR